MKSCLTCQHATQKTKGNTYYCDALRWYFDYNNIKTYPDFCEDYYLQKTKKSEKQ